MLFQGIDLHTKTFLCNSFFLLCASVMPLEQCVVAEAMCNRYLRYIKMRFLSKNYLQEKRYCQCASMGENANFCNSSKVKLILNTLRSIPYASMNS
jgi:hypothetical protein